MNRVINGLIKNGISLIYILLIFKIEAKVVNWIANWKKSELQFKNEKYYISK